MRIFSRCFVAVMTLVVIMALPVWSQQVTSSSVAPTMTTAEELVAIDRLAKEIAKANPQYPDPYKVPIEALIRVPNPGGMDAHYYTQPWQLGQMGCFWHIAAHHLFGKRMSPPYPFPIAPPVIVQPTATERFLSALQTLWNDFWWLLLLVLAIAIAPFISLRRERRMNYHNDPPVVAGGLSENPAEALRQVQAATTLYHEPGRQVIGARHGEFRSRNGRNRVALRVEHTGPNGLSTSDRWVNNGDRCTEVTVSLNGGEPFVEYWLQHCGNRFGEIRNDRFQMPDGWEFVPTSQVARNVTEAAPEVQTEAEPALNTSRRNDRTRDDKFTAKIIITNNGGTNPTVQQIVEVTADRYATQVDLPGGGKVTF